MTQDIKNTKRYVADEGKVFQRVYNGFSAISEPYVVGDEIILGQILVDAEGHALTTPINDDIHYYEEVDAPKRDEKDNRLV